MPPEDQRDSLTRTDIPRAAGGVGALWSTAKQLRQSTGLIAGSKALLAMNQPQGFDCPGCAWPEPPGSERSRFEFCENGAKAFAEEATLARADPALFAERSLDDLRQLSDYELGQLGRVTHPMVLEGRHYRPVDWDRAIAMIASELVAAGPQRSVFYTSGRTSNEAAFLYQLVARMFGTNNFPDCSNMCHDSSGVALTEAIGVGKGTVSLSDFSYADLIFVIGQNPGTNHPRMLTTLRDAAVRGATIVAVNPLRELGLYRFAHPQKPLEILRGVPVANQFVQIQIGGDHAFLIGLCKAVLEREAGAAGVIDTAFVEAHTANFQPWRDHISAMTWPVIVEKSGITESTIRSIAELYIASNNVIACWAMGLTQHKHAVATIQEIVHLMLLRGNIGRRGAGLCPVRGHSNVQGDRTMGITHRPTPQFLDALGAVFGFEPPRHSGFDTVGAVQAMARGDVSVFVAMGGNFAAAVPDTPRAVAGLENCALTVGITTKLNRTQLYPGTRALILPCLGRSEVDPAGFVTVEDSMSMVHRSRGVREPASAQLRSEPAIVAALGHALLGDRAPWNEFAANYDRIRDAIEKVVPGFESFNQRAALPDGFQLPNVGRDRSFATIGGRARFSIATPPDLAMPPGRLRMMTIRSHDQYNTTIYGLDDRYRGIRGHRRVVFVNPTDMSDLGLVEHQVVDLVSEWDDGERVAERFIVVPFDLPRGNAATYFPEANPLVPLDSFADRSRTPTSKSVVIRIRPRALLDPVPAL